MAAFLFINNSLFISDLLEALLKKRLTATARLKDTLKPVKKTCVLMSRDESGVLEPHTDLLSVALAVIGFMVFAALMSQTYLGYEDRSFALENYETASLLAENLADAPALEAENSGLLSAASLDTLSGPNGASERAKLFAAFSGNYQFLVEVRTKDGQWHWRIKPENAESDAFADDLEKVAASVPVVIELNPAESITGTLTVVIYKTKWN
ncbi:hypothetical protein MSBRW_2860 [Methanosarcina barkeri str. Wiesmoor]|uniref:Uncharacterized protein n=2 Tax=Methanosarcina barkeri TaxID=2208 RepID=A0A0E3QNT3_METBA|nr:hypothetical protein [Methanosarcina barkeri]AKB52113.1 hypothetical protein MSBRW_2860 [Methanosarcina barkeri str. Wiesmoor]